ARRINLQLGVDSRRAARYAEAPLEHSFRLSLAEKLVVPQRDGEFQQVFGGRITAAGRAAPRRRRVDVADSNAGCVARVACRQIGCDRATLVRIRLPRSGRFEDSLAGVVVIALPLPLLDDRAERDVTAV